MRRVAGRIGGLFAVLVMLPWPLGLVPGTHELRAWCEVPFDWGVQLLASLLGLGPVQPVFTGSGDTLYDFLRLLFVAIVAVAGGLAWTVVDRRDHARIWPVLRTALRYWLGFAMITYGLVKVFPMQFDVPLDFIYDQRVGDKSPMGLLWLFMGYSRPYTMFTGLVELAAGGLLLWRRTQTIGAVVAAIAMTQVVMLNLTYDVPVKLYSMQLLVAAIAVGAPDARRVLLALLGRAIPEVPPRVRSTPTFERVRLAAKLGLIASLALACAGWLGSDPRLHRAPPHQLRGTWDVAMFAVDGQPRPPLATDRQRWARLAFPHNDVMTIRFMTEDRAILRVTVDERAHTIDIPVGTRRIELRYAHDDRRLEIDGELDGHAIHARLVRAPEPLLESRGFHWIQEAPFHR